MTGNEFGFWESLKDFYSQPYLLEKLFMTFVVIIFLVGFVGGKVHSNSKSSAPKTPETQSYINKFQTIGINATQEKNIREALNKCGITQVESIKRMDYSQIGFDIKAKNVDETIFLYVKENNKNRVEQICFSAEDLYMNGKVLRKLADYTLSTDQRLKIQISSEDYVRKSLKSPSTAHFPNYDEWNIYKKHGVIFAESYVDSQNSFGAVIRSHFKLTIKNNRVAKYTMDGQDLLN